MLCAADVLLKCINVSCAVKASTTFKISTGSHFRRMVLLTERTPLSYMYWLPLYDTQCSMWGHLWRSIEGWANWNLNMEWYWASTAKDCGSHEPRDGTREKVLIAYADVARHAGVSLPERLRHALQLGAHLDEAVQLDAGPPASHGEAMHQRLRKLGAEVVTHLSQSWGQGEGMGEVTMTL